MKKKVVALILLIPCLLMGCEDVEVTPTVGMVSMEYSDFNLITDQKTGIVYIDNEITSETSFGYKSFHVYTPYYGKNGKPCKFVDGKVVEVE